MYMSTDGGMEAETFRKENNGRWGGATIAI